MATLKKLTRVGADVRQIARLLQAKAPEGHMLAYITPEEASLLKSQGGSGKEHADTGIPSYEMGATGGADYGDFYGDLQSEPSPEPPQARSDLPVASVQAGVPEVATAPAASFDAARPFTTPDYSVYAAQPDRSFRGPPTPEFLPSTDRAALYGRAGYGDAASPAELAPFDTTQTKTIGDRFSDLAKSLGVKEDTLGRLGLGGLQAVLGAQQAKKAAEQGRAGKEEMQKLAAPYQAKGAELQRAAQAGELTPAAQQQMQAAQAQLAQQATARGGVGAAQSAAQIEAFRNQLLQQQYDYGLKLSGIGDQIALGAIKTGMQADQYVNQLTSSYYNNIARTLYGAAPVTQQQQFVTGAA